VDPIEQALAAARAEHARLSAELQHREQEEQEALEQLRARHAELTAKKKAGDAELAEVTQRVADLERTAAPVELSRRQQARKARNAALRLGLGTIALVGWLMASTTGWDAGLITALLAAEIAAVWPLANLADHLGLRDG